ncbi:MAG TPA: serine protease [Alphaproteobacteria bacterium]|jgi:S1-C subfamily serine protease|nr:serine protease [Alphaproteobacteria bacterium]MDP6271054.1 serine protease [Alphaproteobacteria bacterium]HJM50679.1 serine protease [Alphaproteobacteria bacterium]
MRKEILTIVATTLAAAAGPAMAEPQPYSSGTGFVINEHGHLVTNNHVVTFEPDERRSLPCPKVEVVSQVYKGFAAIVGREPGADLAVLKLELPGGAVAATAGQARQTAQKTAQKSPAKQGGWRNLSKELSDNSGRPAARAQENKRPAAAAVANRPYAVFTSDTPRIGQSVIAMGYPFSTRLSDQIKAVTGVVASTAGLRNDVRMLQISAPINSGNSGGPVYDQSGQVAAVTVSTFNKSIRLFGVSGAATAADAERLRRMGIDPSWVRSYLSSGEVPQNVNFAIKGQTAMQFLDLLQVPYHTAPRGADVRTEDVVDATRAYTVKLICYVERG